MPRETDTHMGLIAHGRRLAGRAWYLAGQTMRHYSNDNCSQMAAAISYYALFSIFPLAILLVSVLGIILRDSGIQGDVIDQLVEVVPLNQEEREDIITDSVRSVARVSGALTLVGLAGTAWSASGLFGAVRKALNIAWNVPQQRPLFQQKVLDLLMVSGVGVLIGASIAGTAALRTFREVSDDALGPLSTGTGFLWSVAPLALPSLLTLIAFLAVYRFVPNVSHGLGDVWLGAAIATALFEALKNGFSLYVAKFNNYDLVYGSLGAVMLFLLWTYLSASVLLLGAEIASEHARILRGEIETQPEGPGRSRRDTAVSAITGLFRHQRPPSPEP